MVLRSENSLNHALTKTATGALTRGRLTPWEQLEMELKANSFYPFVAEGNALLVYRVRYVRLYWSAFGLFGFAVLIIALSAIGQVTSPYFVFTIIGFAFSLFSFISYRHVRIYTIDQAAGTYSFQYGNTISSNWLNNIFIRLRKRMDSGKPYYYLILDGVEMDQQILSAVTPWFTKLREIGQKIAANLEINYFDEHNMSVHHRVIHFKNSNVVPGPER